jgi:hypothetical protein
VLLLLAGALAGFLGGLAVCEQRLARLHATQAHELQLLRDDQHQLRDRPQRGQQLVDQLEQRQRSLERFPTTPNEPR